MLPLGSLIIGKYLGGYAHFRYALRWSLLPALKFAHAVNFP